jgi:hypothetical protein
MGPIYLKGGLAETTSKDHPRQTRHRAPTRIRCKNLATNKEKPTPVPDFVEGGEKKVEPGKR